MSALAEKDVNVQPTATSLQDNTGSKFVGEDSRIDAQDHSQALDKRLGGNKSSNGIYVSPSDAIMSPATQKLAGFKQKQINKQSNPTRRSLFSRTLSSSGEKNAEPSMDDPKWGAGRP